MWIVGEEIFCQLSACLGVQKEFSGLKTLKCILKKISSFLKFLLKYIRIMLMSLSVLTYVKAFFEGRVWDNFAVSPLYLSKLRINFDLNFLL